MISKSEPALALAAAPLFAGLPSEIVSSLALEMRRIELAPGELLWRQGEASGALHLVESGRLTVTVGGPGDNTASNSVGAVQVGGGNTSSVVRPSSSSFERQPARWTIPSLTTT